MRLLSPLRWAYGKIKAATGGLSDLRHPTAWLQNAFGVGMKTAGVSVTPDSALSLSSYYRALALISQDVAQLPFKVHRKRTDRGSDVLEDHAVTRLIDVAPNPEMGAQAFREVLTHYAMSQGLGAARIEKDMAGTPVALWPVHPNDIRPIRLPDTGELFYEVRDPNTGRSKIFVPRDLFIVHGLGPDGIQGYSVAKIAARGLGVAIATENFGAGFYENGIYASGVVEYPNALSFERKQEIRRAIEEAHAGGEKAFRAMVLDHGATWKQNVIPPGDAQFLETRKFTVTEIARWFGIPPHKLADLDRATFSNIEEQSIDYFRSALIPWLRRWENEVKRKLFGVRAGMLFAKHNVNALLRGDFRTRAEGYRAMFEIGVMSPNDIRDLEDLNPIEGEEADLYYARGEMTTLELIAEPPEPEPVAPPPMPEDDDDDEPEDDPSEEQAVVGLFRHVAGRMVRREFNAIAGNQPNDRGKVHEWLNAIYRGQRAYMAGELPPVLAVAGEVDPERLDAWLGTWHHERLTWAFDQFKAGDLGTAHAKYEPEAVHALVEGMRGLVTEAIHA